jgi:hypothetical protein
VAYYTYMFAQIKNKDQYQIAYSRVRASVLVGKCGSGLLSQVVISYLSPNLTGYIYLIYISIFGKSAFFKILICLILDSE